MKLHPGTRLSFSLKSGSRWRLTGLRIIVCMLAPVSGCPAESLDSTGPVDTDLTCNPQAGTMDLCQADARLDGSLWDDYESADLGISIAAGRDVTGDGLPDAWIRDYYRAWLVSDAPSGLMPIGVAASAIYISDPESISWGVQAVVLLGDVTGDGLPDLAVSDILDSSPTITARLLVFPGPPEPTMTDETAQAIVSVDVNDYTRPALSAVGDIDADGVDDLLVGVPEAGGDGRVYIVLGPISGTSSFEEASGVWSGTENDDDFGRSVAGPGDLDGDGLPDLVIGAPSNFKEPDPHGRVYLLTGPGTGFCTATDAYANIEGDPSGIEFGNHVSGAGDLDGDGIPEFTASAKQSGDRLYVFSGDIEGTSDTSTAIATFDSPSSVCNVSGEQLGDLDGDGHNDLLVGSPGDGRGGSSPYGGEAGAACVVFGPVEGGLEPVCILGENTGDSAGASVAAAGDMNGDGQGDLWVGARFVEDGLGAVYFVGGDLVLDFVSSW